MVYTKSATKKCMIYTKSATKKCKNGIFRSSNNVFTKNANFAA